MANLLERRSFLGLAAVGTASFALTGKADAWSFSRYASLDDLVGTKDMIKNIGTAVQNDVPETKYMRFDDGKFTLDAKIGPYSIHYEGHGYEPEGRFKISSKGNTWIIDSKDFKVKGFRGYDNSYNHSKFHPAKANNFYRNLQRLLNIPNKTKQSKGTDLNEYLGEVLNKASQIPTLKVERYRSDSYRGFLGGYGSYYKEKDFSISYYSSKKNKKGCGCKDPGTFVSYRITEGDNMIYYWRKYDMERRELRRVLTITRKIEGIETKSKFSTEKGKKLKYIKGVYNKKSAQRILQTATQFEETFTELTEKSPISRYR